MEVLAYECDVHLVHCPMFEGRANPLPRQFVMSNSLAITGASGFIGRHVVSLLSQESSPMVVALGRSSAKVSLPTGAVWNQVSGYDGSPEFLAAIEGCATLVHLADASGRQEDGTLDYEGLAKAVGASSVSRVILASSIYARLDEDGQANPYGRRKRELEDAFRGVSGLTVTALRMPPVYGAGCGGGFAALAGLVRKGAPLPLKQAVELRDYIAVGNVAGLVAALVAIDQPEPFAAIEPSDGSPISTADLAVAMGQAMDRPARLFGLPAGILHAFGRITGKGAQVDAMLSPLHVATSVEEIETLTGWRPQNKMPETLSFLRA